MKMKKIVAGLLATAMVITGISIAPKQEAEAAVATEVIYEKYTSEEFSNYFCAEAPFFDGVTGGYASLSEIKTNYKYAAEQQSQITAGTKNVTSGDYLFGGWYWVGVDSEGSSVEVFVGDIEYTGSAVFGDKEYTDDGVFYFAKWVPASVLSVKAQNTEGITAESDLTNTRVISAVDSLDYMSVGFEILLNNATDLGELTTTKVYDSLKVSDTKSYTASEIFGASASHFIVWRLTGIEQTNFEKIIYVRPYWFTPDGVRVDGLAKYVHVEDGYNKYISVPVNLKDYLAYTVDDGGEKISGTEVAAGVFEISYEDGLTLVEDKVELGHVFGEMEFADKGTSVKFAANVADINENVSADDIYVNLRFILDTNGDGVAETPTNKSYDFEIKGTPDFCDNGENKVTVDIWDVLY